MMNNEKLYPKKNPLPLIMYPPQMYNNNIGDEFLFDVVNIEEKINKDFGMYVAIPFCQQQCLSCPYFIEKVPGQNEVEDYVNTLIQDLIRWSKHGRFEASQLKTVYIGGGTGSIISTELLNRLLDCIYANFNVEDTTITLEANPTDLNEEKIDFIVKDKRITAVSIGVQSFNDKVLHSLGAPHKGKQALDCINSFKEKGFDRYNVDLIFNMPGHRMEDWKADLEIVKGLGVKHFTVYPYRLHWNSAQSKLIKEGKVPPTHDVESDYVTAMHKEAFKLADDLGLTMYMPNYWSAEGYELPYNHWNFRLGVDTLGVGPGGYSYINGVRFGTEKDVEGYMKAVKEGRHLISTASEKLSLRHQMERFIIQCLHCLKVDDKIFRDKFGVDVKTEFNDVLQRVYKKGVLKETEDGFTFTALGADWPINVLLEFFDDCFWGDKSAVELPVWAMNESMVDLISVQKAEWLGEE